MKANAEANAIQRVLPGVPVVGVFSGGEIGPSVGGDGERAQGRGDPEVATVMSLQAQSPTQSHGQDRCVHGVAVEVALPVLDAREQEQQVIPLRQDLPPARRERAREAPPMFVRNSCPLEGRSREGS